MNNMYKKYDVELKSLYPLLTVIRLQTRDKEYFTTAEAYLGQVMRYSCHIESFVLFC